MSVSCYESFKQDFDLDSALIIGINVFFLVMWKSYYSGILCVSLDQSSENGRDSERHNSEQNL
jgi:hypothetical protein